jgi:hypothetical protein
VSKLRKLARGKSCYMRLQGCTHDTEQTVLAHIRRGNVAGIGQKPVDVFAIPMCDTCHGIFDGRYRAHTYTRPELDAEALRALGQWLDYLWKEEFLIVVAA